MPRRFGESDTLPGNGVTGPELLIRRSTQRTIAADITGCEGFRANFRGAQLEEYRTSFQAGMAQLISNRWIPDPNV